MRDNKIKNWRWLRSGLDKTIICVDIFLFGFMVVAGTYQILVRYLFNNPSTVSEELLTYAFAWMSLLAAVYVFGKRGHMRMGFLADRLKGRAKRALDIGIECLILLFAAVVMVYGGMRITSLTMTQRTASLGIAMGYIYGIVPVCGVLIMIYAVMNLIGLQGGDQASQGAETEKMKKGRKEDIRR